MEEVREMSMWTWWERLAQDLRYALRGFRRSPAFAATAVLSLALGIGANTAIFSILNTLVLRPLPVRDPATLFQVVHSGDGGAFESSTYALYEHLRAHAKTIAGDVPGQPDIDDEGPGRRSADAVVGQQVTGDYFNVLGIRPVIGTVIEPRDERGSTPNRVVVLGHAYWMRRFGRDPGVLGRTITIDQVPSHHHRRHASRILRTAGRTSCRSERPARRIRGADLLEIEGADGPSRTGRVPRGRRSPT